MTDHRKPTSYPVAMMVRITRQDASAVARIAEREETSRQEIVRRAIRREIESAAKESEGGR